MKTAMEEYGADMKMFPENLEINTGLLSPWPTTKRVARSIESAPKDLQKRCKLAGIDKEIAQSEFIKSFSRRLTKIIKVNLQKHKTV